MKRSVFGLALVLAVMDAAVVRADLVLDLEFTDATTTKSVASGDTVLVNMFLRDSDASTVLAASGLSSGGGRLFKSAGAAVVTEAAAPTAGTNAGTGWFSLTSPVGGVPVGTISSALTVAPFLDVVGMGSPSVHIAQFALTVTGGIGETATITADVLSSLTGNVAGIFPTTTDLDAVLTGGGGTFGSVTFNVNSAAVPEASTLLVACLLLGGAAVRWRNSSRQAAACRTTA
ncbi:MAG: hypothetical protein KDA89_18440 [Planctomycetaceae bacterium]|nr:hypothetical protein [Planctomycetaceae bacterium]